MILRNKIIISAGSIAVAATASTALALSLKKEKIYTPDYSEGFSSSVNAVNEIMSTTIKGGAFTHFNGKVNGTFLSQMISFNNKYKTFSINFKSLFEGKEAKTIHDKAEKMVNIGRSIGVVHSLFGWKNNTPPSYQRYNPVVDGRTNLLIPTEYLAEEKLKPTNNSLDNIVGVPHSKERDMAIADVSKFDIYGFHSISLPKVNSKGEAVQTQDYGTDDSAPILIDPYDGTVTELSNLNDQDKFDKVKEAVLKNLVLFSHAVDLSLKTTRITNAASNDFISDSLIASFSLDDNLGVYTSSYNKNSELLKFILSKNSLDGQTSVMEVISETKANQIAADPLRKEYLHKYGADGVPIGITPSEINFHTKDPNAPTGTWGIIYEPKINSRENLLAISRTTFSKMESEMLALFPDDKLNGIINSHKGDQNLFTDSVEAHRLYDIKNQEKVWLKPNSHRAPTVGNKVAGDNLISQHGVKFFDNYGFLPNSLLAGGSIGKGSSISNLFYQSTSLPSGNSKDAFFNNLKLVSSGDAKDFKNNVNVDLNGLFAKNTEAIGTDVVQHPFTSINHPLVFSTADEEYTFIDFVKNYRTSKDAQARKIFSKDEFKDNIFKNGSSASDADLIKFIMTEAMMFESGTFNALKGTRDIPYHIVGKLLIDVPFPESDIRDALSPSGANVANLTPDEYKRISFDQGFLAFESGQKTEAVEKVLKYILTRRTFKLNDLGENILGTLNSSYNETTVNNKMYFDPTVIDQAILDAKALVASNSWRSSFVSQATASTSSQTFVTEGEPVQQKLENAWREYVKDHTGITSFHTFSNDPKIGSDVRNNNPEFSNDIMFSGVDFYGNVLNMRKQQQEFHYKATNGVQLTRYASSTLNLSLNMKNGNLFLIDKYDSSGVVTWLTNATNIDDRFVQLAAFLELLDKMNIRVNLNYRVESVLDQAAINEIEKKLNEHFGIVNISSLDSIIGSSNTLFKVELKQGNYVNSLKEYTNKLYQAQSIRGNEINLINDAVNDIDNIFAKI